jgi:6-phosphogluconolactonase
MSGVRPQLAISEDIGTAAGEKLALALDDAVSRRGEAQLAISGGNSPIPVFHWLARHLDAHVHDRLTVTFVDERHLPTVASLPWSELPAEINLSGAWNTWFRHRQPRVVPLLHSGTPDEAVAALSPTMLSLGPPDVVLLGFGPDGHVGSLFPGHRALALTGPLVGLSDSPKPPSARLSMSLPWLAQAAVTVVIGTGADKAAAAAAAYHGGSNLPLERARPRARWHWILDAAAANAISGASQ